MLVRIVRMKFEPDKTESFLTLFRQFEHLIRAFDGCHHLELLQDINDPTVFSTYSLWSSEFHLNNYRSSDFFGQVWKQTKVLFADKPQAWSYVTVAV